MLMASIVMLGVFDFSYSYYENSLKVRQINNEFSNVNSWLKALQKIIYESWEYLTINPEILSGWQCEWSVTELWTDICYSKFWFIALDPQWNEKEYTVELQNCSLGNTLWKQLVYTDWLTIIPLFWTCIYSNWNYEINHLVEFQNNDIKEKIIRYSILTENWIYKETMFLQD